MLFKTIEDYDKAIAESDERIKDLDSRYKKSRARREKAEQNRVTAITSRLKDAGYPVTIEISNYGSTYTYLHLDNTVYHIDSYLKSKTEDENVNYLEHFIQLLTACHQFVKNPENKIKWSIAEFFALNHIKDHIFISEDTGYESYNADSLNHTLYINYDLDTNTYSITLDIETETRSKRLFKNQYPITKDINLAVSSFYDNDLLTLRYETTQPTTVKTLNDDLFNLLEQTNPLKAGAY